MDSCSGTLLRRKFHSWSVAVPWPQERWAMKPLLDSNLITLASIKINPCSGEWVKWKMSYIMVCLMPNLKKQVFCLNLFFEIINPPLDELKPFVGCMQNFNMSFLTIFWGLYDKTKMAVQHKCWPGEKTRIDINLYPKIKLRRPIYISISFFACVYKTISP